MELIFEITLLVFALGSAIATFAGAQKIALRVNVGPINNKL